MEKKKKCFIITPIGSENEPIRRHIEGIIDAAIIPALGDQYDVVVAHRINVTGTITKQVIAEIYNADLVIANLTGKNPNVMYELAFRHCLGTPLISIADQETNLPADIISERTIFYVNDAKGVLELQENLRKYLKEINFEQKSSPILDALSDIVKTNNILEFMQQSDTTEDDVLKLIIKKLDQIENSIEKSSAPPSTRPYQRRFVVRLNFTENLSNLSDEAVKQLLNIGLGDSRIHINSLHIDEEEKTVAVSVIFDSSLPISRIRDSILTLLEQAGFSGITPFRPK
ncbi:MAG: hypothetical protein HFF04_08595 [Oscillospiraceae bacterium]|nr:hypothetical protein [Oscillospiraceae bacterium]